MKMLKNILNLQNIVLRPTLLAQNIRGVSGFKGGLIQLPPKKIRYGRSKLLLVMGSGTLAGAYAASCLVAMLESWEVYPDVADDDY